MQSQADRKMHSTVKREKIFNVRKLPYKQFDNQKCCLFGYVDLKYNCSPLARKEPFLQHPLGCTQNKSMEYQYQLALMASPAYKELHQKYREIKEVQRRQKEEKLKVVVEAIQLLKQKEEELEKYVIERQRLLAEKEKLLRKRDQLRQSIEAMRERREAYRVNQLERNEQYRIMNVEELRNMVMGMHYQGGVDIDPDNMTYQELLQLEQHIGKVSKGLNENQLQQLERIIACQEHEEQLCSICYYNVKTGEQIHKLQCKHIFHCDCIKEWLVKQKTCPLCKQELHLGQPKQSNQNTQ